MQQLTTFRTKLGWCAMVGRGSLLQALTLGHRTADAAMHWLDDPFTAEARLTSWNRPLARRIVAALDGEPDDFADVEIDLDHLTPFGRRVIADCRKIGWGRTRSYAQLATAARAPRAARAVGHVMAMNRTPLVVPCHRVVASGGGLGGYSGPQGIALKRRLLKLESACACC